MGTRAALIALGTALAGLLAACGGDNAGGEIRTVTVTPTPVPSSPAPPISTATTTAALPTPTTTDSPTAPPTDQTKLPGTCDSLLPLFKIEDAVGTEVPGRTAFVVGKPEKAIKRLAYINCRYGLTREASATRATPQIEIGVSLYTTPEQAELRITATVEDAEFHGATATETDVDGRPATLLIGGEAPDYGAPLLVVASGQRTIAVSIAEQFGDDATREAAMQALAQLAIEQTGG